MTSTGHRGRPAPPAALVLLLLLGSPSPLRAQFPSIAPGSTVQGQITSLDPVPSARGPFKAYEFRARAGDRLTATLRSNAFDAYLRLARQVGGITDELESDDDSGGDTDASVRFTVPEDGTYLLIAQALDPDGSGEFALTLEPTAPPTTAAPRPIRLGQVVPGELAETDAIQDDDDTYYDTWTIDATAGQRLIVLMESSAFDAFLSFGRTEPGGEFTSIASNDDGTAEGDSTNARMRVRVPETGTYEIRANSVGVSTGPYRLTVLEGPPPPEAAQEQPIVAGEEMAGSLDESDAVLDDDSHYEYWIYQGRAGERLRIRMRSGDFDTFLAIGRLNRGTFQEIASNDDGPDGTDSELEVTLAQNGAYAIRASTLGAGLAGEYSLIVTRSR